MKINLNFNLEKMLYKRHRHVVSCIFILCTLSITFVNLQGQNDSLQFSDYKAIELSVKSGFAANLSGLERFLELRLPRTVSFDANNMSGYALGGDIKLLSYKSENRVTRLSLNAGYLLHSYHSNNIESSYESSNLSKDINSSIKYRQHEINLSIGGRFYLGKEPNKFTKYLQIEGGLNIPLAYSVKIKSSVDFHDELTDERFSRNFKYSKSSGSNEYSEKINEDISIIGLVPVTFTISGGTEISTQFDKTLLLEFGAQFNYQWYDHYRFGGNVNYDKVDLIMYVKFGAKLFQHSYK